MNPSDSSPNSEAMGTDTIMARVYDELRRAARARFRDERPGHTLQPTAVVHEVYLRLKKTSKQWESETDFRRCASKIIRRVLIDHARGRKQKMQVTLSFFEEHAGTTAGKPVDILALNEALERLEKQDPQLVEFIELHYFGGLTLEDTAEATGLALGTLKDKLVFARSWLYSELTRDAKR